MSLDWATPSVVPCPTWCGQPHDLNDLSTYDSDMTQRITHVARCKPPGWSVEVIRDDIIEANGSVSFGEPEIVVDSFWDDPIDAATARLLGQALLAAASALDGREPSWLAPRTGPWPASRRPRELQLDEKPGQDQ